MALHQCNGGNEDELTFYFEGKKMIFGLKNLLPLANKLKVPRAGMLRNKREELVKLYWMNQPSLSRGDFNKKFENRGN